MSSPMHPSVEKVIDELEASVGDYRSARVLPAEAYASADFFEFEKGAVYDHAWLCVGREDQVANVGDYFTTTINDDPLVVVRDSDGSIKVLANVCQHRGHLLAEGAGNTAVLRCPLHYWAYNLAGELTAAPEMGQTVAIDRLKAETCLPSMKVEVWHGFIFTTFDPDLEPLAPSLWRLDEEMAAHGCADMVSMPTFDIPANPWNWKEMLENAIEPYHTAFLHKGPHDFAPVSRATFYDDFTDDENVIMHPTGFKELDAGFNATTRALFPVIPTLSEEQRQRVMFATVPPMLFLGLVPDHMFYYFVLPKGPHEITLRVGFAFPKATLQIPNFDYLYKAAIEGLLIYNDQDVDANIRVHEGMKSRFAPRGRYARQEATLPQFNQWLVKHYRTHAQRLVADSSLV